MKRRWVLAPIVGATGVSIALSLSAHADANDPLSGSTDAIFLWRVDLRHGWKPAV